MKYLRLVLARTLLGDRRCALHQEQPGYRQGSLGGGKGGDPAKRVGNPAAPRTVGLPRDLGDQSGGLGTAY